VPTAVTLPAPRRFSKMCLIRYVSPALPSPLIFKLGSCALQGPPGDSKPRAGRHARRSYVAHRSPPQRASFQVVTLDLMSAVVMSVTVSLLPANQLSAGRPLRATIRAPVLTQCSLGSVDEYVVRAVREVPRRAAVNLGPQHARVAPGDGVARWGWCSICCGISIYAHGDQEI